MTALKQTVEIVVTFRPFPFQRSSLGAEKEGPRGEGKEQGGNGKQSVPLSKTFRHH